MSVGTIVCVIWIASSIDTSTTSAAPVRDARRHAVAAASAAYTPVTYSPMRPPTVSGGRPGWPWIDRLPARACSTSSVETRPSSGPP